MNDMNDKNACGYADLLIAVLYDEASPEENAKFSTHTERCAVCAAELNSLGSMRETLGVWREAELQQLDTGNITSAVNLDSVFRASDQDCERKLSVSSAEQRVLSPFERLSRFFDFSGGWAIPSAVFGALIFITLTVFAFNQIRSIDPSFSPEIADNTPTRNLPNDNTEGAVETASVNKVKTDSAENSAPIVSNETSSASKSDALTATQNRPPRVKNAEPAPKTASRTIRTKIPSGNLAVKRAAKPDMHQIAAEFVLYNVRNTSEDISLAEVFGGEEVNNR